MSRRRNLDRLIQETRDSQRNIVFPDTVRNGRSVDLFLWKGSAHPTLVQRIGARTFGVMFMVLGLELLSQAVRTRVEDGFSAGIVIIAAISLSIVLVGIRMFRNGFPRRANSAQE